MPHKPAKANAKGRTTAVKQLKSLGAVSAAPFDPTIRLGDQVPSEDGVPLFPKVSREEADAVYEADALSAQRAYLELANRIANCEALSFADRLFATHAIRYAAGNIQLKPTRNRGQAPKLAPNVVAFQFAELVKSKNLSKTAAYDELAGKWGVSIEAIKKALLKYGDQALELWDLGVRVEENVLKKIGY